MKKLTTIILSALLLIICSVTALAASKVPLYSQPDAKSKVIDKVKLPGSFVQIYTKGDWIKIGDTKNGKVGWISQKDFEQNSGLYTTTFTQQGKNGNQVVKYTGSVKLNKKQVEEMIMKMKKQQADMQKKMNEMFQQNIAEFNQFMQDYWKDNQIQMRQIEAPVDQAILIVPSDKSKQAGNNNGGKSWWQKFKDSFK